MSAELPTRKLTAAEYLAIEWAAEFKSEFYDGVMYPMYRRVGAEIVAGASPAHNRVEDNLIGALGVRFGDGPCRTYSSDQRVCVVRTGLYTYPDILIVCDADEVDPNDRDTLTNPRAVIEILADRTEAYDRGTKFRHYEQIPGFQEYILVAQDRLVCERFTRQPSGGWQYTAFVGVDAELVLTVAPVRIPLAEIYRNVELPPPALRQPYASRP